MIPLSAAAVLLNVHEFAARAAVVRTVGVGRVAEAVRGVTEAEGVGGEVESVVFARGGGAVDAHVGVGDGQIRTGWKAIGKLKRESYLQEDS